MKTLINKGFTLLEVMIALAILGISLLSLYVSEGNSLLMSGQADRATVASFLAQEQMVEWRLILEDEIEKNKFPDDKEESGQFEAPYSDYRWQRRVRKIEIPLALPDTEDGQKKAMFHMMKGVIDEISKSAREVQVRVYWGDEEDKDKQEEYKLTTHIVKLK
jgi:prepilin-type N-terminal cleavage/methylation domain-containing protein